MQQQQQQHFLRLRAPPWRLLREKASKATRQRKRERDSERERARARDGETERRRDGETDRQTDRQTDKPTNTHTERKREREKRDRQRETDRENKRENERDGDRDRRTHTRSLSLSQNWITDKEREAGSVVNMRSAKWKHQDTPNPPLYCSAHLDSLASALLLHHPLHLPTRRTPRAAPAACSGPRTRPPTCTHCRQLPT
jgi:hypothetical protein